MLQRFWLMLCSLFLLTPAGSAGPRPETWSSGPVAGNMATLLAANDPVTVAMPQTIVDRVTQPTALFYFSPGCPHCQEVMPEINGLAQKHPGIAWLGIATGSTTEAQLAAFRTEYAVVPPTTIDVDRGFAQAVGARSTPTVYLTRPHDPAADKPALDAPPEGHALVVVEDWYTPWPRGTAPVFQMRRHPGQPFADFGGYQGDRACAACHLEETKSWALTMHASAYGTLYSRDRAGEAACVKCHVTGMDEPTGFVLGDDHSPLAGVTCEACHGPSGPHDPAKAGQPRVSAADSCVGCHDADHSIAFTVAKGLPHIDHFAATALSETEYRDALHKLASGERERPLLAFPEGPTVGDASCKSCHKAEHKWWKKDPHSKAMATLAGPDADRAECVRCHATQRSYGLGAGTGLADYATEAGGVGCESCHGPGGAHAAAPNSSNIVGLGESCPECVIEAVCTSCHTPEWDPTWELKKRLEAVGHGE